MNEDNVVREAPRRKRRSLWWLWLLLFLLAFGGGIILGLKLNTLPLPAEVKDRLYPVLESYIPGSTAARGTTPAAVAPAPTPVPEETAEPVPTPAPEVIEALVPEETAVPAVEEPAVPEKTLTVIEPPETTATVSAASEPAALEDGKPAAEKKYIGVGAALETALAHAKVEEKDAEVSGVQRAKDEDGNTVYHVSFRGDDFSYEYMIDAVSGEVEGWSKSGFTYREDMTFAASFTGEAVTEAEAAEPAQETATVEPAQEAAAEPVQEVAAEPAQEAVVVPAQETAVESARETAAAPVQEVAAASAQKPTVVESARERIGEERAKEIAFEHAGVKPEAVRYSSVKTEIEHGVECYDVDFVTATRKFEYEIDAYTGEILAFEQDS